MNQNETYEQSELSVYFCGKDQCTPGLFWGPSVRPHYLIHFVLNGKGIYQHKGITYSLKKGDAFLIRPMERTYYQADQNDPWKYIWVGFDGKLCASTLTQTTFGASYVFHSLTEEQADEIADTFEKLLTTFDDTPGNTLKTTALLLLLLSEMPRQITEKASDISSIYHQKAKEYIENNYSYPIKISDMAHYIGIDRTYLYRIFMEQENLSPKQYLLRHRLRTATELLCSSNYTITEIALSCGFKDTSAFCNYFRQSVGKTPSAFRKEIECEHKHELENYRK